MTVTERFMALLVSVLSCGAISIRTLWSIKGAWDNTNAELSALIKWVADYVYSHGEEHKRLERRDDRIESKVDEHVGRHRK